MSYLDLEKNDPYLKLRLGTVVEVYNDSTKDKKESLGKVKLRWLDWNAPDYPGDVDIMYSCFSNPIIKEDKQKPGTKTGSARIGSSYGILYMPSIGDIAVCGFRESSSCIVLGFLPFNFFNQTSTNSAKSAEWGTFRLLESGEFDIKSERQAEVYLTEKGTIRLLVKGQTGVAPTAVPTAELAEIIIGKSYVDENYSDTYKTAQAKDVVCHIKMISGAGIKIDSDGNIEIDPASGKEVNINSGSKGAARDGDSVSVSINPTTLGWSNAGGPVVGAPATLSGSINSGSSKVKIG